MRNRGDLQIRLSWPLSDWFGEIKERDREEKNRREVGDLSCLARIENENRDKWEENSTTS